MTLSATSTAPASASKLMFGDCLEQMDQIRDGSVDLIYLDPPFFSERRHTLKNRGRDQEFSFDDIWKHESHYAEFLHQRIGKMWSLLKDSGSIFVHCDKSANHIVRAILDSIFGVENFQSEIIWHYKRWSNAKKGLLASHQNIYFYSKTKDFKFNKVYMPYSATTNLDQILQRRSRDEHNKSIYARDKFGDIQQADAKHGVPLSDVWDIPYLNPKAKERVGYPTQKPLLLLERIIELVTDENDLVLDPFCGSGTTCVAAKISKRDYIGIDVSEDAIQLASTRLENPIKTDSAVLNKGRQSYEKADMQALQCLSGIDHNPIHRNQGIDAILVQTFAGTPVLVKVQREHESLLLAQQRLHKAMLKKGAKKGFLIQTKLESVEAIAQSDDNLSTINQQKEVLTMCVLQTPSLSLKIELSQCDDDKN